MRASNGIDVLLFQAPPYAAGEGPVENVSNQKQNSDAREDVLIDVAEIEGDVGTILGPPAKTGWECQPSSSW